MSKLLAQFSVPNPSGGSTALDAPSGIPSALKGGVSTAGTNLIQTGLNIILIVAAFIAIIMLMVGGIQWMTSTGDPDKIASAKKRIFVALIGLLVVISAFFVVNLILRVTGNSTEFLNNPGKVLNQ